MNVNDSSQKQIIVFGVSMFSEVIHHQLANCSEKTVAVFTVDREYLNESKLEGLPVVAFEEVERKFPVQDFDMFVAIGYRNLNHARSERLIQVRNKGYKPVSIASPGITSQYQSPLKDNCCIMDNVSIMRKADIGENVIIWNGCVIGHHCVIGDHCWISPSATICGNVKIGNHCFIGANVTINQDVQIGNDCFIGSNCLVTEDLPDDSVVVERASDILKVSSKRFMQVIGLS